MSKTLKILNYITLGLCIVFSFLQISTIVDLSFSALWASLAFTALLVYFCFYKLEIKCDYSCYKVANKLYEYVPFVYITIFVLRRAGTFATSFTYDVVCVVFWLLITIISFITSRFYLSEKNFYKRNPGIEKPPVHKKNLGKKAGKEILEWVDAFIQAVFTIILLNIFIFQLYEIPSESMVDQFLVKDRVLVFKVSSGPKFPMTKVGLKDFKKYRRGDITVFHNPHYPDNRSNELRTFYSQLVFMLTLTKVNLNVDENGQQIADPLVKRVCGVGGEQLVMLDGVLYHRTDKDDDFTPVTEDAKWANWNLNEETANIKAKIQTIPLAGASVKNMDEAQKIQAWAYSQKVYETLLKTEEERRNFDIASFKNESQQMAKKFENLVRAYFGSSAKNFVASNDRSNYTINLFSYEDLNVLNLFPASNSVQNKDYVLLSRILDSVYGLAWFNGFMTDWTKSVSSEVLDGALFGGDMYTDSLFRMNLMIKKCFGDLVIRDMELLLNRISPNMFYQDDERNSILDSSQQLVLYMSLNDSRNMMVFPPNNDDGTASFIPEGCYFMMGDNRFNSLDMRHKYESTTIPLIKSDDFSATYPSILEPRYVSHTRMMGSPCFLFWPLNRAGVVHSMREK